LAYPIVSPMVATKVKNTVRMKSVREKGELIFIVWICLYLQYSVVAVNAADAYLPT
jgi:fumarate reductase subunit C